MKFWESANENVIDFLQLFSLFEISRRSIFLPCFFVAENWYITSIFLKIPTLDSFSKWSQMYSSYMNFLDVDVRYFFFFFSELQSDKVFLHRNFFQEHQLWLRAFLFSVFFFLHLWFSLFSVCVFSFCTCDFFISSFVDFEILFSSSAFFCRRAIFFSSPRIPPLELLPYFQNFSGEQNMCFENVNSPQWSSNTGFAAWERLFQNFCSR